MHALAGHAATLVEHYGVAVLFAAITFETLGLPLPGESLLIAASAAAAAGKLDIRAVAVAAWLAAVLGDNIGYLIGRRYGRAVILSYGARIGVTHEKYSQVEAVAAKYGPWMVVAARFVVLLRQLNGLTAGTTGMPWGRFVAANLVGAGLWVGFWTTLAYHLALSAEIVPFLWHHLSVAGAVAVLAVLVLIGVLYRRLRSRRGDDDAPGK